MSQIWLCDICKAEARCGHGGYRLEASLMGVQLWADVSFYHRPGGVYLDVCESCQRGIFDGLSEGREKNDE